MITYCDAYLELNAKAIETLRSMLTPAAAEVALELGAMIDGEGDDDETPGSTDTD